MKVNTKQIDFRDRNLVFVDIETTGLSILRHEIIEIGALVVNSKSLKIIGEYEAKIAPVHIERADREALKINGFSQKDWKGAKSLESVLREFNQIAKDCMLIGWGVVFDHAFIAKAYEKAKIVRLFDYHHIDVVSIAYPVLYKNKEPKRLKLRVVADFFGIKMGNIHRAMEDSFATYQIYKKLIQNIQ